MAGYGPAVPFFFIVLYWGGKGEVLKFDNCAGEVCDFCAFVPK
jgi:hypothetical protein